MAFRGNHDGATHFQDQRDWNGTAVVGPSSDRAMQPVPTIQELLDRGTVYPGELPGIARRLHIAAHFFLLNLGKDSLSFT
jgi:hypothetical protein